MKYLVCAFAVALIATVGCKQGTTPKRSSGKKSEDGKDAPASYHAKVSNILQRALVNAKGESVSTAILADKKYLLVYYAAEWNPESKDFTPDLVGWYTRNHANYEVVFVSSDRSEEKMLQYMTDSKMPWPGVKYRSAAHRDMAKFRRGGGLPCLVLLDADDTRLAGSYDDAGKEALGPENAYEKLKELLKQDAEEVRKAEAAKKAEAEKKAEAAKQAEAEKEKEKEKEREKETD